MSRIKRGKGHLKRRKHLLEYAKGFKWGRKAKIKLAKPAIRKAGVYAYRDRRRKKREMRKLWQIKINAGCRALGMTYSRFMAGLRTKNIILDRKILADLAENHPETFKKIVEEVKK